MASPIVQAIKQICEEKGLSYESVLETIETALAAAYRKDFGSKNQNIEVKFDPESADIQAWDVKTVVEDQELPEEDEATEEAAEKKPEAKEGKKEEAAEGEEGEEEVKRFNPKTEIMITEAQAIKKGAELDEVLRQELEVPGAFGRMAAQTAKQVITQKLREAEREIMYNEYKEHEAEVLIGTVRRREGRVILVDLGRATGIMRPEDQMEFERYNPGDKLKVYVRQVALTSKGPEILVSRTAEELVHKLFEVEIPEIADGLVEIRGLAREAGSRSKVAVYTEDDNIDPIGACIGQRGTRIQTIINELGGEKIDIIEWAEDPVTFIINALSPAKVEKVDVDEAEKIATVNVPTDQLSLAIGKGGQNVRLAARLTGWKINITEDGSPVEDAGTTASAEEAVTEATEEAPKSDTSTEEPTEEKEETKEEATEETKEEIKE